MTTQPADSNDSARLREILQRGLCGGSNRQNGMVCVEQAIAIACGCATDNEEHSAPITDAPDCVSPAVRRFAIVLNDAQWSSPAKRSQGLTAFALAQLGTQLLDETEFARRIAIRTVSRILPLTLRKVAEVVPQAAESLEQAAKLCEGASDLEAAESAASAAWSAASAAESAASAASAAWSAASAAKSAAWSAASAAKSAAKSAAWSAAWSAAESAASAAESAAWSAASAAKSAARDEMLCLVAQVATEVLDEMREGR